MDASRRKVLKAGGSAALFGALVAAGFFKPEEARAAAADWNKAAFSGKTMAETLKAMGANNPAQSNAITITGPDIAENGAVVPVTVQTTLPRPRQSRSSSRRIPTCWRRASICQRAPSRSSARASRWGRRPTSMRW